jgi:preprotein translocase subunit SecG
MNAFIMILIVLAAIMMILTVLVQKSKGGGLASGFSSSNQIMGVRKTTDFLEKLTWGLAGTIICLSIATAHFTTSQSNVPRSQVEVPVSLPFNPAAAPEVAPVMPLPAQTDQEPE